MVIGISGFYVIYVAYRNLKSLLPLVRDVKYDSELRVVDRLLLLGHDPATLTQDLFGTGLSAHCSPPSTSPTSPSWRSS